VGVRAILWAAGTDAGERLSFFAADLVRDDGWAEAVAGCDHVIHVASPIPIAAPKTEDELIVPARYGALRVLRAARDADVRRVVLTSSCGAIYYGYPPQQAPFDETSWTNLDGQMSAYVRSKAIAERAAWDFMAAEGGALELSAINPAGIFGPVLGPDYSSSIELVKRLLNGMPGCPRLHFGVVDVRDVADLHVRAMTLQRVASGSSRSPAKPCRCSTSRRRSRGASATQQEEFLLGSYRTGWCV
jgi:nucleoside-diphosphate-sugar epimerase